MRGLRAPHSLYVRAEKRRNQAVLEMLEFPSWSSTPVRLSGAASDVKLDWVRPMFNSPAFPG